MYAIWLFPKRSQTHRDFVENRNIPLEKNADPTNNELNCKS